ncbi:hypothetical protein [Spirosoma sp.]|uniref:DoxX family protein n=1 Tax=Spirosoma sp. TaxID=1899569 RepID=UPI003B3A1EDE
MVEENPELVQTISVRHLASYLGIESESLSRIRRKIGLLFPETQFWVAWGLILLLIAIFPANINVAINNLPPPGGLPTKPWYVWSRLFFHPLYILWRRGPEQCLHL